VCRARRRRPGACEIARLPKKTRHRACAQAATECVCVCMALGVGRASVVSVLCCARHRAYAQRVGFMTRRGARDGARGRAFPLSLCLCVFVCVCVCVCVCVYVCVFECPDTSTAIRPRPARRRWAALHGGVLGALPGLFSAARTRDHGSCVPCPALLAFTATSLPAASACALFSPCHAIVRRQRRHRRGRGRGGARCCRSEVGPWRRGQRRCV
jgi:hypothetical protein